MAKIKRTGYAVLETNKMAAIHTGEIIAQYEMADDVDNLQNGIALAVNHATREVVLPEAGDDALYIHASEEQIYEDHLGRNSFILKAPKMPRLFKLYEGDIFETNAIAGADEAEVDVAAGDYLAPDAEGMWEVSLTATNVQVQKIVMLPNGQKGVKAVVL